MQPIRLFEGDSLDVLATIPDHTYTAVITDPPYGLSVPPDPVDVIVQWLLAGDFKRDGRGRKKAPPPGLSELAARFANTSGPGGMLGFKWDAFVPGPALWREVFRTCKPGAIALVFASTRTQHWMALSLVLAGFEILDTIGWVQAQGMAKSGTVDKRIDARAGAKRKRVGTKTYAGQGPESYGSAGTSSRGFGVGESGIEGDFDAKRALTFPVTDDAKAWEGWSTQLGPALEPIIVARKPCEGTAVENILRYGCGAMNIDACRIVYGVAEREVVDNRSGASTPSKIFDPSFAGGVQDGERWKSADGGRWPKNAMFSEESAAVLDVQVGQRKSGSRRVGARKGMGYHGADGDGGPAIEGSSGDASRFFAVIPDDVADAVPAGRWPKNVMFSGEAAQDLDALVPHSRDGVAVKHNTPIGKVTGQIFRRGNTGVDAGYGGAGGVSRFFWVGPLATDDDVALPIRYVPKAARRERNAGLPSGVKGDHPTKKPRKLMEWLCRLAGHPKGRILDPFAGSGSTLAAARAMGLPCDGVERDEHYCRDLAAPTAGVDPADVVHVSPPASDAARTRPLDAAARVPYYETVRPPRPPVTFPIAYPASAPAPTLPVAAPRVTEDDPPPVLSLEIPAPIHADASYGLPPMFPRLPGASEVP